MQPIIKFQQWLLAIGDAASLYLALSITILIEYGAPPYSDSLVKDHFESFTYLFLLWLAIFYISGLYDVRYWKNDIVFIKKIISGLGINATIAVIFFYVLPLTIAPKTNLIILLVIAGVLQYLWRSNYNKSITGKTPVNNVLLIDQSAAAEEIIKYLKENPQLGYKISFQMKDSLNDAELNHINEITIAEKINLIVIPDHLKKNTKAARIIYRHLALGLTVLDSASFYEEIFNKVPVDRLEESWFLEKMLGRESIYDGIKQPIEIIFAIILFIVLLPLFILISLFIKLTSSGPILYKQTRIGQYGADFILYKFRTMIKDAEAGGAQWAKQDDQRITPIGKILRHTHLDELPQLINVIKGELSFVGPRPERPEFTEQLREEISHYDLRHMIRPGITGWAQLNYRYGASVKDAREKLRFDIYYIKHRSFWLDTSIVLKTTKLFFIKN